MRNELDWAAYAKWTDSVWVSTVNDLSAEGLGLCEEAGEVAGKIRKYMQGRKVTPEEISKELGDVFFFWTRVAKRFDLNLADIVHQNQDKLEARLSKGVLIGEGDNR